jgi:putative peptide zinc metalloprotease protein
MPVDRPTFSESWYRVAELKPRLRPTVQIHRQHYRGQMWHVVQDPSNNQFFRLSDSAYRFIALLDGQRTVAQSWKICNEQLGDYAPTQGEAIQLMGQLYVSNLLLSEVPPDAGSLLNRYRKRIRREVQGYLMNMLFIRIPLYDPDHFLNRWVSVFGRVFSVFGIFLLLALLAIGFYFTLGRLDELIASASKSASAEGILSVDNLPLLYVCFALIKVFHEFGHAFSCKKFGLMEGSGGEVHVMGIMFLVFAPFPYVDASSSWAFRSKWHRMVVGSAGVLVELGIASIAAVIWASTADASIAHKLAYNVIFVAGVSTILFNGNPLLRYDGYYVLSDALEIPNLAQRSKDYLYYLVRKYVWKVRQVRNPAHTRGEQIWMLIYAVCSTVYRWFICVSILMFVADQLFILGAILAIAAAIAWVCVPIGKFLHYLMTSPELLRVRTRALATTFGALLVIVGVIGLIPMPDRSKIEGVVQPEPSKMRFIRAQTPGFVESFLPTDTKVSPDGPPLIVAGNDDLQAELAQNYAKRDQVQAARQEAQLRNDPSKVLAADQALQGVNSDIAFLEKKAIELQIKAPFAGTWISPSVDRLMGTYLNTSDPIGMVVSLDDMIVRAVATQDTKLEVSEEVEIRAKNRPDIYMSGKITQILPSAQSYLPSESLGIAAGGSMETAPDDRRGTKSSSPFFEIRIAPDKQGVLLAGQRVMIRLKGPDTPLAKQWWHMLLQVVQKRWHS